MCSFDVSAVVNFFNNQSVGAFLGASAAFLLVVVNDWRREREKIKTLHGEVEANLLHARTKLQAIQSVEALLNGNGHVSVPLLHNFNTSFTRHLEGEILHHLSLDQRRAIESLCCMMESIDSSLAEFRILRREWACPHDAEEHDTIVRRFHDSLSESIANLERLIEVSEQYLAGSYRQYTIGPCGVPKHTSARESHMSGTQSTAIDASLDKNILMPLYQEQWVQIRHLDSLDFRTMAVLPIVASVLAIGAGYIGKASDTVPGHIGVFAFIVVLGISFSGCYTTFRNWLCYMRRLTILTEIERQLHLVDSGIIRGSLQFRPPKTLRAFSWSLVKSIRFPLTAFYAALGGTSLMILKVVAYNNSTWCFPLCSLLFGLAIFLYCHLVTYYSLRNEFSAS
jgi:hypothetical protein